MSNAFTVKETIDKPVGEVWAFLADMRHAPKWMTGVEDMRQLTPGSVGLGTRFRFVARGAQRETEITAWEPEKRIALTSTQGGITATYEYSVLGRGDTTEVELNAVCRAKGPWKIIHPIIVVLMRKSDSGHLVRLKNAIQEESSRP
ncbi:MAG: SRPBCC family protein [Candidatus Methylomirabilales bacterium]